MTDERYPPLRPQTPARRHQPTPWPMIIGVIVLGALATILAVVLFGGDGDDDPAASPGASETAPISAAPSADAPSPTGGTPTDEPATGVVPGSVVVTSVEGLAVRAQPGTAAERLGSLAGGALSFVAGGPTDADGHRWYLVSGLGLPPASGCAGPPATDPYECPVWFGWVAGTGQAGEPWLVPHAIECFAEPLTAQDLILARTSLQRLACFGATPFTFRAWWPTMPDDAEFGGSCAAQDQPSGWLVCQNVNNQVVTISESEGDGGIGARISIDPATGLTMPERGTWVELRVHLDDPAAQGCDDAIRAVGGQDRPLEQYVLECRAEMVLEAVQAVDGP
ncbi:MAG TPA: hypothetical protein VMP86_03760 [Candidatus Binatia bacterium]|nr:hypothetical protein [Candidatus Binatia bacterium]